MKQLRIDIGEYQITGREILVCFIIVAIMLGLGSLISSAITNSVEESNETVNKAYKIDNNADEYNFAVDTHIGNLFAFGEFESKPVRDSLLNVDFSYIERTYQKYVQKTRTVTYQEPHTTIVNGKSVTTYTTKTRTETYWEWDNFGTVYNKCDTFTFLKRTHNMAEFDLNVSSQSYYVNQQDLTDKSLIAKGGYAYINNHERYDFDYIPVKFNCIVKMNAGQTMTEWNSNKGKPDIIPSKGLNEYVEDQLNGNVGNIIFWVFWILLTSGAIIGFVLLSNNYLY